MQFPEVKPGVPAVPVVSPNESTNVIVARMRKLIMSSGMKEADEKALQGEVDQLVAHLQRNYSDQTPLGHPVPKV